MDTGKKESAKSSDGGQTPRTENSANTYYCECNPKTVVNIGFARSLERELNEANYILSQITPIKNSDIRLMRDLTLKNIKLESTLAELRAISDGLAESIEAMQNNRDGCWMNAGNSLTAYNSFKERNK